MRVESSGSARMVYHEDDMKWKPGIVFYDVRVKWKH